MLFWEPTPQAQARSRCQELGGDLAGFSTKAEHAALYQMLAGRGPFWVGLAADYGRAVPKEYWYWLRSGQTPNYTLWNPWYREQVTDFSQSYQFGYNFDGWNFAGYNPDNVRCAAAWPRLGGFLLAVDCNTNFAFVCEIGALFGDA